MLAEAYLAKGDKPAAIAELQRYAKIGGRNPESLKQLATLLEEAGPQDRGRRRAGPPELHLSRWIDDAASAAWATCGSTQDNAKGAIREFAAVLAKNPLDPAQAHFDLARAYHAGKQDEQAKDELLAALEAAPGFRPAQKLLLELSTTAKN